MLFSLLTHYLELYITDTALKVSRSLYCFTTSISRGVKNYFPRMWGIGISDTIFPGVNSWYKCISSQFGSQWHDSSTLISHVPAHGFKSWPIQKKKKIRLSEIVTET